MTLSTQTFNFPPPPPEQLDGLTLRTSWRWGQRIVGSISLALALALLMGVALGVVPMVMGMRPFVIISGSMEPTIHTGSVVITQPIASTDLKVGDIIAYNPRAEAALPIVHRIVEISERKGQLYATTRGDANNAEDQELALGPVSLRVDNAIPWIGFMVYYAAQPLGTLLLVWGPLVLLAVLWFKDRIVKIRQARR